MRLDHHIFAEIPGYLVVSIRPGEWGVVYDGKLIQAGLSSEEEARQRAGSNYLQHVIEFEIDQHLRHAIDRVVRQYVAYPKLPDFIEATLIADLCGALYHFGENKVAALVQKTIPQVVEERERQKKLQEENTKSCEKADSP